MSPEQCRKFALTRSRRRGAVAVETAFVLPVLLFLLLAIVIGGTGIFRYQQVACQAREAARYACVRGADYQKDSGLASPTQQQIIDGVIQPMTMGMAASAMAVQVQWIDQGANATADWDSASKDVRSISPLGQYVSNTVRVTVKYQWVPGMLIGPLTLTSVCELPMSH